MNGGEFEQRMACPACGRRNHSVTFLADGPTTYHDCGHTNADLVLPVPGPSAPAPVELSPEAVEQMHRYKHGQQSNPLLGERREPPNIGRAARAEAERTFAWYQSEQKEVPSTHGPTT